MDRFFASINKPSARAAAPRSESLSSWTDIVDSIPDVSLLTDDAQPTDAAVFSVMPAVRNGQRHEHDHLKTTNGLEPNSGSPTMLGHASCAEHTYNQLTQVTESIDPGLCTLSSFKTLPTQPQRLIETGAGVSANDSLSTSSMDYMWDLSDSDVAEVKKFNSLPHGGVYSTTNGSLSGSPLSARRQTQTGSPDQTDKIKTTLLSAWNNMRHGWTVRRKTAFKYDDPIWILGKCYHSTRQEREDLRARQQCGQQAVTSMECFKRDFTSRIWFTYRQNFPVLFNSQYTTDVGWGCMIRSGQMMLAQAFVIHFLGREWRWHPQQRLQEVLYHHQIIRLFGDSPSDDCPFSMHKLVEIGERSGRVPGDWYGPASVAHVFSEAVAQAPNNPLARQICIYVARDCTVYKQDVYDLCVRVGSRGGSAHPRKSSSTSDDRSAETPGTSTPGLQAPDADPSPGGSAPGTADECWKTVVILVPVRLGGDCLNEVYVPCVQNMLMHRMCLGVIGGKPKHSVYFVGWQADKLVYLDPHFCQETVDVSARNFSVHSYHCMSPRKLQANKMDPSCTLGFLCKTRVDFETFIREASQLTAPPVEKGYYPMFTVVEGRSADVVYPHPSTQSTSSHQTDRLSTKMRESSRESDDFVFL